MTVNKPSLPTLRDGNGRFLQGSAPGPGNPYSAKVNALRRDLLAATDPADVLAIWQVLIEKAKAGNLRAGELILERLLGRPTTALDVEALKALEATEAYELRARVMSTLLRPRTVVEAHEVRASGGG